MSEGGEVLPKSTEAPTIISEGGVGNVDGALDNDRHRIPKKKKSTKSRAKKKLPDSSGASASETVKNSSAPSMTLVPRSLAVPTSKDLRRKQVERRNKLFELHSNRLMRLLERLYKSDRYDFFTREPTKADCAAAGVEEPMCFNSMRQLASEGRYSKEAFLASDYEKREDLEDQNVCRTVGAAVLARGTKTDEKEYKAKILAVDQKKGKVHVHFQGWRSKFDEWVPFKNVRTERQKQKADRAEQERLSEADLEELPSARSPEEEPEKNPLTVDWDAFENDVALIVKNSLKSHPVSDEVGTVYHAAQKLQKFSMEVISAAKEKQAQETRELYVTELVDRVARENREPAMQQWRKEPFVTRSYSQLQEYVPASEVPSNQVEALLQKLEIGSSSTDGDHVDECRWILPAGDIIPGSEVLWEPMIDGETWKPLRHGEDVVETNVWGIDSFTRRNIDIVLSEITPTSLRMSLSERSIFVTRILLPALNAQEDKASHDMRNALKDLLAQYSPASGLSPTDPGTAVTAQNPLPSRRSLMVPPSLVADATNPAAEVSAEKVLAAAKGLLHAYTEWDGTHYFTVHPKGNGVIVHPEGQHIRRGDYVNSYVGELYPPWLWERKEAEEEAKRRQKMVENGGKVILPEFWNIRLELPRYPTGPQGYDILYVDASRKGNFCSRMSHSCSPNMASSVAVVNGKFTIALRALRDVYPGEELTQDYNCVTDSLEEFKAAVCLCGNPNCRGAFLYCTADEAYRGVLDVHHTTIHRMALIVEAASDDSLKELLSGEAPDVMGGEGVDNTFDEEYARLFPEVENHHRRRLAQHGLGRNALGSLPTWIVRFAALSLRFSRFERRLLPQYLRKQIVERKTMLEENAKKHGISKFEAERAAAIAAVQEAVSGSSMALNQEQHAAKLTAEVEEGEDLIGRPVKVFWPIDKAWYHGYVEKYYPDTKKHGVRYDDGHFEDVLLCNETVEYLPWKTFENSSGCVICRRDIRHDKILLCDGCDEEFHMYCLQPPMTKVPEGRWFCPVCSQKRLKAQAKKRNKNSEQRRNRSSPDKNQRKEAAARAKSESTSVDTQPWDEVQAEGVLEQRVTNLVVTLNKVEHKLVNRVSDSCTVSLAEANDEVESCGIIPAPLDSRGTTTEWWVGDVAEARWVGDDAADYPDWYSVRILHVYENGTCYVEYVGEDLHNVVSTTDLRRPKRVGEQLKALSDLQAPIRRVSTEETIDTIWSDEDSILARIIRPLKVVYARQMRIWTVAEDKQGWPYYWNLKTREVSRKIPPILKAAGGGLETKENLTDAPFPDSLVELIDLFENNVPKTMRQLRKGLKRVRELLMEMPDAPDRVDEDSHEVNLMRAADLIAFYENTRIFFVPNEPWLDRLQAAQYSRKDDVAINEEVGGGDAKTDQSVVNAANEQTSVSEMLLGWLDQATPKPQLCGPIVLPDISSAFAKKAELPQPADDESLAGKSARAKLNARKRQMKREKGRNRLYHEENGARDVLIKHLADPAKRYSPWPHVVREAFPYVPSEPPSSWPPPPPPTRLFGSPIFDAVLFENAVQGCDRVVSRAHSSSIVDDLVDILEDDNVRDPDEDWDEDEYEGDDEVPPDAPETGPATWIQCEFFSCQKWRKLPPHVDAEDLQDPFYCSQLKPYDPKHGACYIAEEGTDKKEVSLDWAEKEPINIDTLALGDWLDAVVPGRRSGSWSEAQVVGILEIGEERNPKSRIPLQQPKKPPKGTPEHDAFVRTPEATLRRIRLHFFKLDENLDIWISKETPNIELYVAPHFTFVPVAPDWENRVANGAKEAGGEDLVYKECTVSLFGILDSIERQMDEEEQKKKKKKLEKRKNASRETSIKTNKRQKVVAYMPPPLYRFPWMIFLDEERELYRTRHPEITNGLKLRYLMQREFKTFSEERKGLYVLKSENEKMIWGEEMLEYLAHGGFPDGIDLCPEDGLQRPKAHTARLPFEFFFAYLEALHAKNGKHCDRPRLRKVAKKMWEDMPDDRRASYVLRHMEESGRLQCAWDVWYRANPNDAIIDLLKELVKTVESQEVEAVSNRKKEERRQAMVEREFLAEQKKAQKRKQSEANAEKRKAEKRKKTEAKVNERKAVADRKNVAVAVGTTVLVGPDFREGRIKARQDGEGRVYSVVFLDCPSVVETVDFEAVKWSRKRAIPTFKTGTSLLIGPDAREGQVQAREDGESHKYKIVFVDTPDAVDIVDLEKAKWTRKRIPPFKVGGIVSIGFEKRECQVKARLSDRGKHVYSVVAPDAPSVEEIIDFETVVWTRRKTSLQRQNKSGVVRQENKPTAPVESRCKKLKLTLSRKSNLQKH